MDNPYQSPAESGLGSPLGASSSMDPFRRRSGMVHHVRVVAILMIVQAALELVAAVGLGALAVFMPMLLRQMPNQPAGPDQSVIWVLPLMYGGMAAAALASGVLHLVAGLRNYRFRGRTFGIVALSCGMLSVLTCYCLPTAVALAVYGLIVYLNAEASEAFRMGQAGCEPAQIVATFLG
jgi:hypothetical protein